MVGPSRFAHGGIASVIRGYDEVGFRNVDVKYVSTYADGKPIAKMAIGGKGIAAAVRALGSTDAVHVHTSSGVSFVRKALIVTAAQGAGAATIIHVHGSDFDVFGNGSAR